MPVSSWNIGRICPNSPEFSVEVVEATVMNSCAAAGKAASMASADATPRRPERR
jgi:hypothetical protein